MAALCSEWRCLWNRWQGRWASWPLSYTGHVGIRQGPPLCVMVCEAISM